MAHPLEVAEGLLADLQECRRARVDDVQACDCISYNWHWHFLCIAVDIRHCSLCSSAQFASGIIATILYRYNYVILIGIINTCGSMLLVSFCDHCTQSFVIINVIIMFND